MNTERIQQIWVEIAQWEKQKESGVSLATQAQIDNDIASAKTEIARLEAEDQVAEQAQHEQKAQEVNGTNSDIAIAILEAVFPDTTSIQGKIGLTEFGMIRTDLLQLFDGALTDRTTTLQEKYAEEMAIRDEKVRLVQKQTNDVRQQLDASEAKVLTLETDVSNWIDRYNEVTADAVKLTEDIREAKVLLTNACNEIEKNKSVIAENESLKQQITELEQKLKVAQQPKADAQLSQSFTDRMNEIKTKNEARIKSNMELAAEGALGFRGKVELPSVPQQELPFPETPTADAGNNQVLDTENEDVKAPQFQTVSVTGPIPIPMAQGTSGDNREGQETPATQEWVKAQLQALELRIIGENAA